jgi:hypothetical protein
MTEKTAIDKVKTNLGYPMVDLEITDEMIKMHLDTAVKISSDYFTYSLFVTRPVVGGGGYAYVDLDDLDHPTVINVYKTQSPLTAIDEFSMINYATGPNLLVNFAVASNNKAQLESLISHNWRQVGNRLYLDKYNSAVTIEYIPKEIKFEQIQEGYWELWIVDYTTALCKVTLGRIRGKYVVDSNPFKTDYDSLLEEGRAEMDKLLEDLMTRGHIKPSR